MRTIIKKMLQKKGLYYPLRYSLPFHLYQLIFKPADIAAERKEILFYRSFLPDCRLIFDIGANDGHKTIAFLKIAEQVVCLEPDKDNFKLLGIRFRYSRKRVFLENKAVSDNNGFSTYYIHHPGSAFNTLSENWKELLEADNMEKWDEKISFSAKETVATITLNELIRQYGVPDFIKIDVEGFEEKVLKGLSQRIGHISFEALLPEGSSQLNNCLAFIEKLEPAALYNIAVHEKLLLPAFIAKNELAKWLELNPVIHFEVIVRMNN